MPQASLLGWVKERGPSRPLIYRFERDIPKIMLPGEKTAGPFWKGDLVSADVLPQKVWDVLLKRRVVKVYRMKP